MATKDTLLEAIRALQNADTELKRAEYTGEQPRLMSARHRYYMAKMRLFKLLPEKKEG